MIRKILFLMMLFALLLAACQPTATPTPTTAPTEEATEAATEEATEVATEEMEATEEATEEMEATEAATEEMEATEEAEEEATEEATPTPESAEGEGEEAALAEPEAEEQGEATGTREELEELIGWTCPEGLEGGTLNIYNWSTYIAENTVSNFEVLCGVTTTYDVFSGNDDLLARLRAGNPGYDIAVPSDYAVATLITEELLIPLTRENIPNFANLDPDLLNPYYDPENAYSVPYQWGTVGIGYNVEAVGTEITSWQQMFEYAGNVAWLDDVRLMMGIALQVLGLDPNTTNPDDINAARDFLVENGANVQALAVDDGQALLERGEVDITVEYNGDIFQIIDSCECDTYAYVVPSEGSNIWVDNLVIPVGAQNPRLAEAFIDYLLTAQVGADLSNYILYASPNQASIDAGLIDAEMVANPGIYPPEEIVANLFYIQELPIEVAALYNDAWDQVKILIGG